MRTPRDWLHGDGAAWIALIAALTLLGFSALLWQMIE